MTFHSVRMAPDFRPRLHLFAHCPALYGALKASPNGEHNLTVTCSKGAFEEGVQRGRGRPIARVLEKNIFLATALFH